MLLAKNLLALWQLFSSWWLPFSLPQVPSTCQGDGFSGAFVNLTLNELFLSPRGVLRGGFLPGFRKPQNFWLVIGTTKDHHHPGIYKSITQQTILCLTAQMHTG